MKKLSLLFMSLIAAIGMSAETVTYDFVNNEYGMTRGSGSSATYNPNPCTISGEGVATVKATGSTRLWADGLRGYKGSAFTVAVSDGVEMTKVVITYKNEAAANAFDATSTTTGYETSATEDATEDIWIGTWTGKASEIGFTCNLSKGNAAIASIEVTYASAEDPTPESYGPETLMAVYTPWWTNTTVMEKADNTFTANGIEITGEGYIQFCTNTAATDWQDEMGTRYAAKDADSQEVTFTDGVATAPLTKGSDKAFNVGEGIFDIKVEFTAEGATMTITKTAEPAPVIPENLLIHHNGQVEYGWTHEGIKMDAADADSFSISDLDLSEPKDNNENSLFHFSTTPDAASWDDVNAGARYGAAEANMPLEFNEAGTAEADLTKQSEPNTFMVKPGKYDMTVKFNPDGTAHMVMTDKSSAITAIGADSKADVKVEYYNLQGMKVENPAAGIYIRRAGDEVSKVAL